MGFPHLLSFSSLSLLLLLLTLSPSTTQAQAQTPGFRCTGSKSRCSALVGYISPNTTTLARIQSLFGVSSLSSLLGANSLPPTTPLNYQIRQNQTVRIPFPCHCINGHGTSEGGPVYVVVKDDGLFHIASDVFAGLMTYQQIQGANNIPDENLIIVGQNLTIPLPCSCDDVDGQEVVHYGHLVAPDSSLEGIAGEFGTTMETLMRLNGITDPKRLMADQVLDVPLRACSSSIRTDSSDSSFPATNGTDFYTAHNCVRCSCDATNNFTLQCEPSGLRPTNWSRCPAAQCSSSLFLGNSTSSGCNRTTCAYAGYNSSSIITALAVENTCAAPPSHSQNGAGKIQERGWSWALVLVSIQLLMIPRLL